MIAGIIAVLVAAAVLTTPTDIVLPGLDIVLDPMIGRFIAVLGIIAIALGLYRIIMDVIRRMVPSKRRRYTLRNVLRLVVGLVAFIAVLGLITERWLGLAVSLGIVGFAITFALQQPLFSLIGWAYIVVKEPYQIGDRVSIEGSKGDVIEIDFLVTTLWEIDGGLVSSNQPSGRIITLPNSVVLSSHVFDYSREEFPYVWNEISFTVAFESDIEFARETMIHVADEFLGDEMARNIARYRSLLAKTPVELEVRDRPSVNVVHRESWIELRLRYLTHPKRSQAVKNELYGRIIEALNEHPDRVAFPVGRNR